MSKAKSTFTPAELLQTISSGKEASKRYAGLRSDHKLWAKAERKALQETIYEAESRVYEEGAKFDEWISDGRRAERELFKEYFDDFVYQMFDAPLAGFDQQRYITGKPVDSPFLRYIDRCGARISEKHDRAIAEYREALENLNRTFLAELNRDREKARRILMYHARLDTNKALDDQDKAQEIKAKQKKTARKMKRIMEGE